MTFRKVNRNEKNSVNIDPSVRSAFVCGYDCVGPEPAAPDPVDPDADDPGADDPGADGSDPIDPGSYGRRRTHVCN
jgi:hypothetical protein